MPRRYGEGDLLELPRADLQRGLLGIGDRLLARAIPGAGRAVRDALLDNVSPRRRAEILRLIAEDRRAGTPGRPPARDALLRLVAQIFRTGSPAGTEGAPPRTAPAQPPPPPPPGDRPRPAPPATAGTDLSPGAFGRLKEARGVVGVFGKVSGYARHLADCRRGLAGAVLARAWLGRRPAVPAEQIRRAICSPPPSPRAKARRKKRG